MSVEEQNGGVTPNREVDAASDRSFDALAKGLANGGVSRRRALKLLGGALLGGVLASIPGVALAAPKPGKGPCQPGQFQCGKKCCPSEASCVKGECVCPAPKTLVGGACECPTVACQGGTVNANCECVCPSPKRLVSGACECPRDPCTAPRVKNPTTCDCDCPTGTTTCGGRCCPSGQGCVNGTCQDFCTAELCCCECRYYNPTTGESVYACQGPIASADTCHPTCQATTPPAGTFLDGSGSSCREASHSARIICGPLPAPHIGTGCTEQIVCAPPPV